MISGNFDLSAVDTAVGITYPTGFLASGVAAGLKASGAPDLALVQNQGPEFAAAAVTTTNRVFAAPVAWTREAISDGRITAVVLNSGGANACTGSEGLADSEKTAQRVADLLGTDKNDVAVCSTGLIGERLPMEKLLAGVEVAAGELNTHGGTAAAKAIMTTDTHHKQAGAAGDGYRIGGMAKGAGMLAPGLATMLVVLTTDAQLASDELSELLPAATSVTFDRIDSDGCMSTNDTVLLLANGSSGVRPDLEEFSVALKQVCASLARQLIGDAEGAKHDIEITVAGAASEADALEVAREIARSNLFKCAIFGEDPNWGRVLSSIGVTKAAFDADKIDVSFNGVQVCKGGQIGAPRDLVDLGSRQCLVDVQLNAGDAQATILTNDLTYDYVKENAEYSS